MVKAKLQERQQELHQKRRVGRLTADSFSLKGDVQEEEPVHSIMPSSRRRTRGASTAGVLGMFHVTANDLEQLKSRRRQRQTLRQAMVELFHRLRLHLDCVQESSQQNPLNQLRREWSRWSQRPSKPCWRLTGRMPALRGLRRRHQCLKAEQLSPRKMVKN